MIRRDKIYVKAKSHVFVFSGREKARFSKGGEAFEFLFPEAGRAGNISLQNLPSGTAAGVCDTYGEKDLAPFDPALTGNHIELCVRKSESEGITWLDRKAVKVPVAHIDTFGIFFFNYIPVIMAEGAAGIIIQIVFCPGVRQAPGGIYFS